jgi:hypothetical protein
MTWKEQKQKGRRNRRTAYAESKDYGFVYQQGFQDLDGRIWELIYLEPSVVK